MRTNPTTLATRMILGIACAVALSIHARPLPVRGEGAEPLPERTYSNAAAILEQVITIADTADRDCAAYGTLSDAVAILDNLADEPVTDTASRARCAALMAHILINYCIEDLPATFLFEYHPDFLDKHHAELRAALQKASFEKDAYLENVLCVYAMLPSCDVTFATNKAHKVKNWWLIRDAILARHGDTAALDRLKDAAKTFGPHMGVSDSYLARVLALVRTKAMVEFLMAGLRAEDVIDYGDGMTLPRNTLYQEALWRMFRNERGAPAFTDYLALEEWGARKYGIPLPKERLPRKDVPHTPVRIPAQMQPEQMHP